MAVLRDHAMHAADAMAVPGMPLFHPVTDLEAHALKLRLRCDVLLLHAVRQERMLRVVRLSDNAEEALPLFLCHVGHERSHDLFVSVHTARSIGLCRRALGLEALMRPLYPG